MTITIIKPSLIVSLLLLLSHSSQKDLVSDHGTTLVKSSIGFSLYYMEWKSWPVISSMISIPFIWHHPVISASLSIKI